MIIALIPIFSTDLGDSCKEILPLFPEHILSHAYCLCYNKSESIYPTGGESL